MESFEAIARIWALPEGMAFDEGIDFVEALAKGNAPSLLFFRFDEETIRETLEHIERMQGLKIHEKLDAKRRTWQFYRPCLNPNESPVTKG